MADLIRQLESNDTRIVEEVKEKFHEQFKLVQDNWLLYGLYDYYMVTNSIRCMEIMVNVREPHYNYLLNKLSDSLKGSKHEPKVQALTLLGHVLRKEPPWLYRITEHHLIKDLLKLLKTETDILLLLSTLLALVVLLPIVPSRMGQYLQDVFEIFSRLAAWNCSNPEKLVEEQMIHMQVALYALFQRLYGMYPCNFLAYLRNQYRSKEQMPIFVHTVKPMLDTVKMHPLLVTASKDKETTTERWKKMGAHDVVVECERFSLDVAERCQHESCYLTSSFRSRSGTTNSTTYAETSNQFPSIKSTSIASIAYDAKDFFSPSTKLYPKTPPVQDCISNLPVVGQSMVANVTHSSQEGTSPPEAAVEATPDTTPIKDVRGSKSQVPPSATAVRALTNLGTRNWSIGSTSSTPGHSQPSSPMRKESSPFHFPAETRASAFGIPKKEPYAIQKIQRLVQDRVHATECDRSLTPTVHPTSPLRIIQNEYNNVLGSVQRIESPVSKEDEEVLEIVRLGQMEESCDFRQCDSVLQEEDGGRGAEVDLEECEQEHGSPCTAGGLHMPNSRSMNDFAKRVRRLRHHSQCATEPEVVETSTGSSPGNCAPFLSNTVRRANSCPEMKKEMKKSPLVPKKDNINKTLMEDDEEVARDGECKSTQKEFTSTETQTENFWPMPYEHLFLGIFPSLDSSDIKPSPAPSPAPLNVQDKLQTVSPYEILDKYIDVAVRANERDPIKSLREQLYMLQQQLLFERHRREIHALKNRRLLADAKNTKAMEEHNSALRDQVQLQQKVIDNLKDQLENLKVESHLKLRQTLETTHACETKYILLQQEHKRSIQKNDNLQKDLNNVNLKYSDLDKHWQQAKSSLLDAEGEVKIAKEQAWAGENIRAELENVSKQLLLSGEMQHRYQEKLAQLPTLQKYELEFLRCTDTYTNEIKSLQQSLEAKTSLLEACRARTTELEQLLSRSDESAARQKRLLSEVAEEYEEKLKALESKYHTQLTVSRFNDERILELWQRIELLTRHPVHSPDTSSCHEVHATATDKTSVATGLSPHSSPLSTSLASSEGSVAFGHSDMKNLQNLVDQKEPLSPSSKASEELDANTSSTVNVLPSFSLKQD